MTTPERPERIVALEAVPPGVDVARPLPLARRLQNHGGLRRAVILIALATIWELYARIVDNTLLFPTFSAAARALVEMTSSGVIADRTATSFRILAMGYGIGIVLAGVFTIAAVATRAASDLLSTLTAMFNPLPAIALLPLALLWFGLGAASIVFVVVHSVLWAVALNAHTGFRSVPEAQRMAGQNYGLRGLRYALLILIPAALPSILSGLKIGWAFAWRTLIAAELVFGVSAGSGGLGWLIFEKRNALETADVFGGLLAVIVIGLLMESVLFRTLERRTVMKWGMQR